MSIGIYTVGENEDFPSLPNRSPSPPPRDISMSIHSLVPGLPPYLLLVTTYLLGYKLYQDYLPTYLYLNLPSLVTRTTSLLT